ncbi:MAG: septum site-determining protein MinC [Neisseriaceae bacterium]|nr:MAG: septum site-determining protein MinC [Neisseriaceae bacterium]
MNSFEIKSTRLNGLSFLLKSLDIDKIQTELNAQLNKSEGLNTFPFILDLSLLHGCQLNQIKEVIYLFQRLHFKVIALQHYDEQFSQIASELNLFFQLGIKTNQYTGNNTNHNPHENIPYKKNKNTFSQTVIIDRPIRSGQQVYAENSDLVVTSLVSEGAEIVADGNIHAYAPVRGRVFAGASGDLNAQIFILSMQAQLVCIAGIYRIFDQKLPNTLYKQNVKIFLQENKLSITAIHP